MNHTAPTLPTADDLRWHDRPETVVAAAQLPCRNADPELWFSAVPEDIAAARGRCGECPIRARCLELALERREPWGVWGGELFERGRIVKPPRFRVGGAGLPQVPPPGVETVTLAEFATLLDIEDRSLLTLLRKAREARTTATATGEELAEPIAGGTSTYPYRWRKSDAADYASRYQRRRPPGGGRARRSRSSLGRQPSEVEQARVDDAVAVALGGAPAGSGLTAAERYRVVWALHDHGKRDPEELARLLGVSTRTIDRAVAARPPRRARAA